MENSFDTEFLRVLEVAVCGLMPRCLLQSRKLTKEVGVSCR